MDGETVVQNERGCLGLRRLREGGAAVFIAFDLLHLDGKDLRQLPLFERQAMLAAIIPEGGSIGFSDTWTGTAAQLLAACEANGLEGIVSKKKHSTYRSGRSNGWLKTKCWAESVLTLVGFDRDSKGSPIALLARESDGNRPAVAGVGRRPRATWLEPTLRLRVRHLRGGEDIRHASVKGLAESA